MEFRESSHSSSQSVPSSPLVPVYSKTFKETETDSVSVVSVAESAACGTAGVAAGNLRYVIHESHSTFKKKGRRSSLSEYEKQRGDLDSLWGEMRKSFAEEKNVASLTVAAAAARAVALAAEALANSIEESCEGIERERFPDIPKVSPSTAPFTSRFTAMSVPSNPTSVPRSTPPGPSAPNQMSRSALHVAVACPSHDASLNNDEGGGISSGISPFLSKSHSVGPGKAFHAPKAFGSPLPAEGAPLARSVSQSLLHDLAVAANEEEEEARKELSAEPQQRKLSASSTNDTGSCLSSAPNSSERLYSDSSDSTSSQPSALSGMLSSPSEAGDVRKSVRKDSLLREARGASEQSVSGKSPPSEEAPELAMSKSQQQRRRDGVRRVSSCHAVIDETPAEGEDSSFRARLLALGMPIKSVGQKSVSSESEGQQGSPAGKKKAKSIWGSTMGFLGHKAKVTRTKKAGNSGVEIQ